jgi:hypothetical protein
MSAAPIAPTLQAAAANPTGVLLESGEEESLKSGPEES